MQKPNHSNRGWHWLFFTRPGNRWLSVVALLLAIAAVGLLRFGLHLLPPCWFFEITGLHCPGCGGVRATLALLRGEVLVALWYNFPVVAAYLALAVFGVYFLWNAWLRRDYRSPWPRVSLKTALVLVLIILAFWVVRNLPFYQAFFF